MLSLTRCRLVFSGHHYGRQAQHRLLKYSFSSVADGDRMVVECVDMSTNGLGICKNPVNSQVVFVPDTYPGEIADIEITGKKKKITYGSKVKTLKSHDGGCEPLCNHFGMCGGCQLQVLEYQHQLRLKAKKVMDAFKRIGGIEVSGVVEDIEGCDDTYYYRNKVEFSVDSIRGIIGKHIQGSSTVLTAVEKCVLQSKSAHSIYEDLRGYILKDEQLLEEIQYVVIRSSRAHDKVLVNIVTRKNFTRSLKPLGDYLAEHHPERLSGVVNSVSDSTRPLEERQIIHEHVVWGTPWLMEQLGSCMYRVSPNSFFQVHTAQTEKMYDFVLNAVDGHLGKDSVVLDLYCGTGTISIHLAQRAKYVYGVEISESSIKDALYNAELNNADNVEFVRGDVERVIDTMAGNLPDAIVVDPARKGLSSNAVQGILKIRPRLIVYVSCHVATQARDIKQIVDSGQYDIVSVKPFDLFPQTIHVENVVVCKRKDTMI